MGTAAVVAAAFFLSQLVEIPARSALRGYDNTFNYLWLRSALVDGDWDFRNDIEACNTLVPEQRASALTLPETATGRIPNKYGVGWALLTLPFYLLADAVVALGGWFGWWSLARDGFNSVYQIAVQTGHAALAIVALVFAVHVVARWIGDRTAAVTGVLAVWSASPLLYYQTVNVSMSHAAAFFAVTLLAFALERATAAGGPADCAQTSSQTRARMDIRAESHAGWWLLAGAAFGLAVITRFQLVVFGAVIAWAVVASGVVRKETPGRVEDVVPKLVRVAWLTLGAAPFLLLQMCAWHSVYGQWVVSGYAFEGETFHWSHPEILASLFSSWHGLFYWHPFLFVAATGMLAWAWTSRGPAFAWVIGVVATVYLSAAWWCWWFASSFGHRAYDAALLPLMAGAAWGFHRSSGLARRVLVAVALGAGLWNAYLALLYRTGAISRHAPVSWAEMLAAAGRLPEALQF